MQNLPSRTEGSFRPHVSNVQTTNSSYRKCNLHDCAFARLVRIRHFVFVVQSFFCAQRSPFVLALFWISNKGHSRKQRLSRVRMEQTNQNFIQNFKFYELLLFLQWLVLIYNVMIMRFLRKHELLLTQMLLEQQMFALPLPR